MFCCGDPFDALEARKITFAQTFGVSGRAWKMPGSRMFIGPKMQVPVEKAAFFGRRWGTIRRWFQ